MRQPPIYTTWKITCPSSEDAESLRQWLSSRIDLDRVMTDTVRVNPIGVEQARALPHRLGDYFTAIRMLLGAKADPSSFRLVFQRRPEAGRYWKDLMVNLLQEVEAASHASAIDLGAVRK